MQQSAAIALENPTDEADAVPATTWVKLGSPISDHPLPWKIRTHPNWPVCDCTDVLDANGVSLTTCYNGHSAGLAQFLVDAALAFYATLPAERAS